MTKKELCQYIVDLHAKLELYNKGDHPYHQFYYLYRLNGAGCPTLIPISHTVSLDLFEKELHELTKAYREYRAEQSAGQ